MDEFELRQGTSVVEFWIARRLPYEPKGSMLAARNALRKALLRIGSTEHDCVAAMYTSVNKSFCDVENVLYYNVQGAGITQLSRTGLSFERRFEQPPKSPSGRAWAHYHRYVSCRAEEILALSDLDGVVSRQIPTLSTSTKPHEIWGALTNKDGSGEESNTILGTFALDVVVGAPIQPRSLVGVIKPLLDGLISAHHYEGLENQVAVERLSKRMQWPKAETLRRLRTSQRPGLGPRNLLRTTKYFVAWNPADHLCVRCAVRWRYAEDWMLWSRFMAAN